MDDPIALVQLITLMFAALGLGWIIITIMER